MAETIASLAAEFDRATGHVHQGGRKVLSQLIRASLAAGADRVVDASATNENRVDGLHTTLQAALDAAGPGERIAVMPGTFTEAVVLTDWTIATKDGIVLYAAIPGTVIWAAPAASSALEIAGTVDAAEFGISGIVVQGVAGTTPIDNTPAAGGPLVVKLWPGTEVLGDTAVAGPAASYHSAFAHFETAPAAGDVLGVGTVGATRVAGMTGGAAAIVTF